MSLKHGTGLYLIHLTDVRGTCVLVFDASAFTDAEFRQLCAAHGMVASAQLVALLVERRGRSVQEIDRDVSTLQSACAANRLIVTSVFSRSAQ